MSKRFIVLLASSSDEQNNKFLEWIKTEDLGWWHWLQDSWLLTSNSNHLSAEKIRDKVMSIFGTTHTLVIELNASNDTWAGYGPNQDPKNMFKWIRDNWS